MSASVDQLGSALLSSGLSTADELKALWSEIPEGQRPQDAAAFAQLLVARGRLTAFQAKELLAGRGPRLVMGDYLILDEIGAGGMGQVYKAQHRRMQRIVALKVMSAAAMKDDASVKRFQREVRAAARLEHPNIVTAYASGESGSVKYLVMQFVDGGDFSSLVKKNGPLPIERAVGYVQQAARGLAYAHGEGVIHRDIKPANLLLDKKGNVKILDMGLARIESGEDDGLTATEQVMGTVDYMSPEQASSTKGADARADIYSLGCTLWFLLTGKKLYEADSMIARLIAHRDAALPSLVKTRDDAPWPLEQALHKMIAKRMEDRFQSMDEVVAALEPFGPGGDSSGGMGSSIGRSASSQNAELAAFMQGMPLSSAAAQTQEPSSKSKTALGSTASSSDVGTNPQSRTIPSAKPVSREAPSSTRQVKPPAKKSSGKLVFGGVAVGAAAIVAILWFSFGKKETEVAAGVAPSVAVSKSVSPSAASSADDAIAAAKDLLPQKSSLVDKLESAKYVWTEPENLGTKVNNGQHNRTPALSADQLCLIVVTEQPGQSDLVEHRRVNLNDPWGPPRFTSGSDYEASPWLTADGLQLLYCSASWKGAGSVGAFDLWTRRRVNRDAPWDAPQLFGGAVNTKFDEKDPCLSSDGLTLAFVSNRPGGQGGGDLWIARRPSPAAPFGPAVNLGPAINSPGNEEFPRFLPNNNDLLFDHNAELYLTFRNASGVAGAVPLPMGENRLHGPWLAPDGVTLYFQRESLPTTRGGADIWIMRRVPRDSPEAKQPAKPVVEDPPPAIQAVAYDGHSYQWVPGDIASWYDARNTADAMGGHLVHINSAAEDDWLKQKLLAELPPERMVWIGGQKDSGNVWRWSDDSAMDFQNWALNEGTDGPPAAVGIAHREQGGYGWADWNATNRPIAQTGTLRGQSRCAGFVVEWDSPTPTPRKADMGDVFNGHRYLVVSEPSHWNDAKAKAEARGGHLLTIESMAEREWVTRRLWPYALRAGAYGRFFCGGFSPSQSEPWKWVTGQPMDMQLWAGNGPDDKTDSLRVVTWQGPASWDDVGPTWNLLPFIVEWDDLGTASPQP